MGTRAQTYISLSALFVAIALSSGTVIAAETDSFLKGPRQADWLVRGSALSVRSLTQTTDIPIVGGQIKSPDKTYPGLDISYFFTDHWAIEFQGGHVKRSYAVSGSSLGNFSVGSIDSNVLSLALQYHFRPTESIKPYVGVGANYAWTRSVDPAQNIPSFDVKPIASTLFAAGIDVAIAPGWLVNASARYLLSPEYDFKGEGFSATVKINTLVLGMGVGFYF
ncbi:OmpW family outer membrane protein [Pseudomonas benzopyrenica]|uniref:OmpW family outer membrane protein n=1 Tax=Pseudomonas benzopyrenica TaxID=2993566 RepID=A0ABZ2FM34_9PSED